MLLKNLSINSGLANGTRLVYEGKRGKALLFKEFHNPNRTHFIGRSTMIIPLKTDGEAAAKGTYLRRLQFPVRLAFATTIHKAQSQTVDRLGLYLAEKTRMFSEGMTYTALSRLRSIQGLRVFSESAAAVDNMVEGKGEEIHSHVFFCSKSNCAISALLLPVPQSICRANGCRLMMKVQKNKIAFIFLSIQM